MLDSIYEGSQAVQVAGAEIRYIKQGEGPPVLLVHGVPLSLLTWRHNLAALARDFTVVAVDLKGFGWSGKPAGDYSPQAHARTLDGVLDTLGIEGASVVGSSYGCAPAVWLALERPERVRKLVLINSVGYPGGRHSLERLVRIGLIAALVRSTLRRKGLGQRMFAARLRKSYASPDRLEPGLTGAYLQLLRREAGEETFLATLRQFDEGEMARQFPRLDHPTLIVWGDRDHILPASNGLRLQRAIAGSRLEMFPGCGHLPHEEEPARFNQLLREFLNEEDTHADVRLDEIRRDRPPAVRLGGQGDDRWQARSHQGPDRTGDPAG
jgi:pimeloyl-ACP methyl ester carboxylesterase